MKSKGKAAAIAGGVIAIIGAVWAGIDPDSLNAIGILLTDALQGVIGNGE